MNKAQLVDVVQKELGKEFSKAAAERSLDAVLRSIRRGVATGGSVQIVGFGTFRVSKRAARMGRNPKTGEKVEVPAKKIPFFKPSKELKDLVNDGVADVVAPPPPPATPPAPSTPA